MKAFKLATGLVVANCLALGLRVDFFSNSLSLYGYV